MYRKVLVANRGEIAVRVIRALHELDIQAVAVFSEADRDALHVALADEAHCLGPAPPAQSYLSIPRIIEAASKSGAEAIHPGYGFLSENPHFAEVCRTWGIDFIGPDPQAIELMGHKSRAKATARRAGVPLVPGTEGTVTDAGQALSVARDLGFPVLIKAAAGGGGRGMRVVRTESEFETSFRNAQREAQAVFGDGSMYVEKYLEHPRHVEVQVLADRHGNIVHICERDSSIQRRYQKLIEEALSPAVTPELREKMCRAAVDLARAVDYMSAGTVEFLVNGQDFYFMEMNTRIQVEHPTTEMVTGIDIVKEQIRVAAGLPLSFAQDDVKPRGWAIEYRLNAEDPDSGFLPSPGLITVYETPGGPGVRVDSGVQAGHRIQPFYDSLFAKLVVWGRDRQEALERSRRALAEMRVEGIKTTIPLYRRLLQDEEFVAGDYHTQWLRSRVPPKTA
ncbi:MAG TPA: acetyl-CoA carboxylase biotin carboxylase subunit [Clostridiales bacterium]|nr:acetyl-CoA carboxylase biotin carboxylase subunit [Clostridiales bacterium]